MKQESNLYRLLKVDPEAETEMIRHAYRYLVAKYHPDNKTTGNKELFDAITAAWKILSDEERRKEYDLSVEEAEGRLQLYVSSAAQMLDIPRETQDLDFIKSIMNVARTSLLEALKLLGKTGRSRSLKNELLSHSTCSFCSKRQEDVLKIIAGPGVNVCDLCVATFNGLVADPEYLGVRKAKCSFCGKEATTVNKLIAGPGVQICDECIDLCNEILEEEKEF